MSLFCNTVQGVQASGWRARAAGGVPHYLPGRIQPEHKPAEEACRRRGLPACHPGR